MRKDTRNNADDWVWELTQPMQPAVLDTQLGHVSHNTDKGHYKRIRFRSLINEGKNAPGIAQKIINAAVAA
jgi:hypothetical protein